jgi:hypothetical protein
LKTFMAKRRDDPFDKMFDLVDKMLGPVEELTSEDVARFLTDAGANTDALKRRLYERASELRGEYWARQANPPEHMQDFLRQLRPPDLPSSDPTTIAAAARKLVDRLLNTPVNAQPEVVFAYRDKKDEITADDWALLDELAKRVKQDAERRSK